ncbi:chemotaxis protein CheW [Geosporobacter ferrireducens]|uniref:CheW-like domain-containing protein n=1 Tax=Geosporobacter ferrireducens TaxID=1424294 RepID=A0A1D8GLP4_9FIRM|nr:chemotaxis protein CheW [Geosporobacter ferrireducens]AOT71819.1 hypothetical protein Gferi_21155 [Geosporobacter ferrireducens]MTI55605.1 chemotaxis protein CheW [Geosporobacter ferrireducens]
MALNFEKTTTSKYLMFKTGSQLYGLPIPPVLKVIVQEDIIPLVDCPDHIKGTIISNDTVIPVIDLLFCLRSENTALSEHNSIIVLSIGQELQGYLVDEVIEVTDILEKMEVSTSLAEKPERRFLDGMARLNDQDVFLVGVTNLLSITLTDIQEEILNEKLENR